MEEFELENNREEEAEPKEESRVWRAFSALIALLLIAGLTYFSGVYQALFYQRTPDVIREETKESMVDAETIKIPLAVFIFSGSETVGSVRSEEDARRLALNASRVWEQAGIMLEIRSIRRLELTEEELEMFYALPARFASGVADLDPNAINVFLVPHLGGANGYAFSDIRSVAVADYTSVYDFRALAHEVGHILGLSHVPSEEGRLMYRGANGIALTLEEILRSREAAASLFPL
jgi:hypothetical protein